ncbi:MAG: DegV family protein [Clostridiaceae bacterium]|nr:DegV family protein [Eubacteriales bacterium]
MADYVITTDSTVDLGAKRMEELGVLFTTLTYFYQGIAYPDDMREESALKIYNAMRGGEVVTTSQANPEQFLALWPEFLDAGKDILYIGFSSGLSGTVNSALLAKQQLEAQYPERRIYIVDSLCASGGEGMFLQHVLLKKEGGATLEECYRFAEALKLRVNHWYTVSELSYLRRGGRVSAAAALFADILGIKPVMNMDDTGHLIPREKVKGRRTAIKRMLEHLAELADIGDNPFFHITHADCMEDAQYLKGMLNERFPSIPVHISMVGAVIGSHCGPGTLALFFIGKPRVA